MAKKKKAPQHAPRKKESLGTRPGQYGREPKTAGPSSRRKTGGADNSPGKAKRKKVTPKKSHPVSRSRQRAKGTASAVRPKGRLKRSTGKPIRHVKPRAIKSPVSVPLDRDTRTQLKVALHLVRRHVKGYSAKEGWGIRDLSKISVGRRGTLLKKAAQLKTLLRQPHDLVKAPTAKARKNLYQFTHQKIRKAKHFIVHKPATNFDVRLRAGRVVVRGKFEGKVRGTRRSKVITESAFFLFPHTAQDIADAERMLRDMLDEMPEGFYVVLTGQHGDTGEPTDKGSLLARLRDYVTRYQEDSAAVYDRSGNFVGRRTTDTGFIQSITGFRFLSTSVDGMELQMQARDIRREKGEEYNKRLRLKQMTQKERAEYEAPRKAEAQRQAKRKAATKGAATRKAKARKTGRRRPATKHK